MTIGIFDSKNGVYLTKLENLDAEPHQHPALEIIVAEKGEFDLSVNDTNFKGLTFAIIESNISHALSFTQSEVTILLLEHRNRMVNDYLKKQGLLLKQYCLDNPKNSLELIPDLLHLVAQEPLQSEYDNRVWEAIQIIENSQLGYFELKEELNQKIPLSESRLAHLFKENVGISIKKYHLWYKLKQSVQLHLSQKEGLLPALLDAGFYDQPHFNKAYKASIGLSPGKIYNSRTVQEKAEPHG